jgi:hypothetical protein
MLESVLIQRWRSAKHRSRLRRCAPGSTSLHCSPADSRSSVLIKSHLLHLANVVPPPCAPTRGAARRCPAESAPRRGIRPVLRCQRPDGRRRRWESGRRARQENNVSAETDARLCEAMSARATARSADAKTGRCRWAPLTGNSAYRLSATSREHHLGVNGCINLPSSHEASYSFVSFILRILDAFSLGGVTESARFAIVASPAATQRQARGANVHTERVPQLVSNRT